MAKIVVRSKKSSKPAVKSPVKVASKPVAKSPVRVSSKPSKAPAKQSGTEFKLTGLSLKGLIRATPPLMKNNAHDIVIKQLKTATTKGGFPAIRAKAVDVSQGSKRRVHDCNIIGKEKGPALGAQKHVLVSCDCEDFCYTWEYALTHWGSSSIKYCNGEPADVKNPQNHPGMCKHLVALARTVIEHGF